MKKVKSLILRSQSMLSCLFFVANMFASFVLRFKMLQNIFYYLFVDYFSPVHFWPRLPPQQLRRRPPCLHLLWPSGTQGPSRPAAKPGCWRLCASHRLLSSPGRAFSGQIHKVDGAGKAFCILLCISFHDIKSCSVDFNFGHISFASKKIFFTFFKFL